MKRHTALPDPENFHAEQVLWLVECHIADASSKYHSQGKVYQEHIGLIAGNRKGPSLSEEVEPSDDAENSNDVRQTVIAYGDRSELHDDRIQGVDK